MDVLAIALEHWIPPILAIVAGAIIASILVPRWQVGFERNRLCEKRRLELLEVIAGKFPTYLNNWRRLIQIAAHELEKGSLDKDEQNRKVNFVEQRNISRDELISSLRCSRVYFSDHVVELIDDFCDWDFRCSNLRLAELPEFDKWLDWERRIIKAMKAETLAPS